MMDELDLNLLGRDEEEEEDPTMFDPFRESELMLSGQFPESAPEPEDTSAPRTNPNTLEVFLERAVDSPLSRAITRPIRDAITISESLINEGKLPDVEDTFASKPLYLGGESLPLDNITAGDLPFAVIGDIFGDTISGAIIGQQVLSRYGGPIAGRVGLAAGAAGGFAKGSAAAIRYSLNASRATRDIGLVEISTARMNGEALGMLVDDSIKGLAAKASESPIKFIAAELVPFVTSASVGLASGLGTDSPEREDIANNTAIGSLIGAIISPATITKAGTFIGSTTINKAKQFFGTIGKSGKDNPAIREQAAETLTRIAADSGTSIEEVLKIIDESLKKVADVNPELLDNASRLPVGSLTNNPFLVGLQRQATRRSRQVSGAAAESTDDYFKQLLSLEEVVRQSGDPQALVVATALRRQYFDTLTTGRLERARENALSTLTSISNVPEGVSPSDVRRGASKRAFEEITAALKESRAVENSLYDSLGEGIRIAPENLAPLQESLAAAKSELKDFYGELPRINVLERIASEGEDVPFIRITASRLADRAAALEASGNFSEASAIRRYMLGPLRESLESANIPELKIAQEYSTALNDTFTRGVISKFFGKDKNRGYKIDPEAMLGRLLSGGGDEAAIRLDAFVSAGAFGDRATAFRQRVEESFGSRRQLLEAVEQNDDLLQTVSKQDLQEAILGFDTGFGASVMRETDMYIRAISNNFIDPSTGQVDATRLATYVRNNRDVIENKFPDLWEELSNADTAARRVKQVESSNKRMSGPTMQRRLFGGIVNSTNPTPIVQRALISPNRDEVLGSLAKSARMAEAGVGGNPPLTGAIDGFRATVLDAAFMNSRTGRNFSWTSYRDNLLSPPVGGGSSLMDKLEELGAISKDQRTRLTELVDLGSTLESSARNPSELDFIVFGEEKTNLIAEAFVGLGGALAGGGAARTVGGALGLPPGAASIQGPTIGSKLSKMLFIRKGMDEIHDLVMEAASDARVFRALFAEFDPSDLNDTKRVWVDLNAAMTASVIQINNDDSVGSIIEREWDDILDLPSIPDIQDEDLQEEDDFFDQLQ